MHTASDNDIQHNRKLLDRLAHVIPKIVDAFDPDEIILFGSYARGEAEPYSDVDLLIIVEDIKLRFQDRSLRALDVVKDRDHDHIMCISPFVYTKDELKIMLEQKESFLISALEESILVWKKAKSTDVERQLEYKEIDSDFKTYLN